MQLPAHSPESSSEFDGIDATRSIELTELAREFIEAVPRSMWAIRFGMREAAGKELTVPQFRVLAQLSTQPRTNGELAELIGVSVPAMSRLVDGLFEGGLVARFPEARDRRQVRLELSLSGRRTFQRLKKHTQGVFSARFSELGETDRRKLREGLEVLGKLFK